MAVFDKTPRAHDIPQQYYEFCSISYKLSTSYARPTLKYDKNSILCNDPYFSSSVSDWWDLAVKIDEYKAEFLSLWKASKLDVLICPTFPFPACPTGAVKYLVGKEAIDFVHKTEISHVLK